MRKVEKAIYYLTLTEIGIREVNPLKTNRQKDFYGGDKSDEIDAKCIAQILLRSYENLPKIEEDNQVYISIREAERFRETLVKVKTQNVNRLHFYLTKTWGGSYKKFFSSLQNKIALEFFSSYPIPQALKEIKENSQSFSMRLVLIAWAKEIPGN